MFIIQKLRDACANPEVEKRATNIIKTMSNDSTVKFVENAGKWMWKRYDATGSVVYRSPLFDSERQAKEDYEANGGSVPASQPENVPVAPEAPVAPTETAPASTEEQAKAEENTTATPNEPEAGAQSPDNTAGVASAEANIAGDAGMVA